MVGTVEVLLFYHFAVSFSHNKESTDKQCLLSPAGVFCVVQVSVRKRVLPVQDGADQLPPEPKQQQQQQLSLLPDGQTYGRREVRGASVRYGCVNLQPLSPLDRTTSQ